MMTAAIHVLYVDDEESLLDMGTQFLEQSGDFTMPSRVIACAVCKENN
jgi:hypothetical protein